MADDDARVLARLDRIDALGRSGAPADELLTELRGLLLAAEALAAESADGKGVVERRRTAPLET